MENPNKSWENRKSHGTFENFMGNSETVMGNPKQSWKIRTNVMEAPNKSWKLRKSHGHFAETPFFRKAGSETQVRNAQQDCKEVSS